MALVVELRISRSRPLEGITYVSEDIEYGSIHMVQTTYTWHVNLTNRDQAGFRYVCQPNQIPFNMNTLKYIGIGLLILVALFFGINLTMPTRLELSESMTINAPARVIHPFVNSMQTWATFNPWALSDPAIKTSFSESTSGVGNWMEWESEVVGSGRQEVIESTLPTLVRTKLNFVDWDGDNFSAWVIETQPDGTCKVTMTMEGAETPLPFRFFNKLMMPEMIDSYQKSLKGLKELAEAQYATEPKYEVKEMETPTAMFYTVAAQISPMQIGEFLGASYGAIGAILNKRKIQPTGLPSALYLMWSDTLTDMMAAMMVGPEADTAADGNVKAYTVPGGRTLKIDYYGAYEKSGLAHVAMDDYMLAKNLTMEGPVREVYVTDPMTEADTSKWLTEIYYRVK